MTHPVQSSSSVTPRLPIYIYTVYLSILLIFWFLFLSLSFILFYIYMMLFAFLASPLCMSYVLLVVQLRLLVLHLGFDKFRLNERRHLPSYFSPGFLFPFYFLYLFNFLFPLHVYGIFVFFLLFPCSIHLRRQVAAVSRASSSLARQTVTEQWLPTAERIIFNGQKPSDK